MNGAESGRKKAACTGKWKTGFYLLLLIAAFCIAFVPERIVQAADEEEDLGALQEQTEERILEEFDFTEIDSSLKKLFPEQKIRFSDLTEAMMSGDLEDIGTLFVQYVKDQFTYEFRSNRKNLVYMLLIAVIAAVFTNFSSAMQNKQVSEISFYVLYMLLITMCLNTFRVAMDGIESQIALVLDFMRVLCPGFFLSVAIAAGSSSSLMFYNLILLLIYAAEAVILRFLLPVINIYIMIQVMNYLLGEEALSEYADLIKKFVSWVLKTMTGCVIGMNVIQGILAPAIDTVKRSALTKTVEAIPGIGNTFGGIADVVLGTAVLIKNGIGMAGAVILILVSVVPAVQMALLTFLYKLAAALVQPVSDKRITGCIRSVSEGCELMLKVLFTTIFLFLLTIAVVAASTS